MIAFLIKARRFLWRKISGKFHSAKRQASLYAAYFPAYVRVVATLAMERRRGRHIVIASCLEPQYIPFIKPILDALQSSGARVSFVLTTRTPQDKRLQALNIPMSMWVHEKFAAWLFPAHLLLAPIINAQAPINTLRVFIGHNQPVKFTFLPKQQFEKFQVHFLLGPLHRLQTEETIRAYGLGGRNIQLYDIGYPKSDLLLCGAYERTKILMELGLDPTRKTIIYAPSWEEGLSLRTFGIKVVEKLLDVATINVIVKLHPTSCRPPEDPYFEYYTGGTEWANEMAKLNCNHRFKFVVADDIDPYLAASDLMVTDISSVAFEILCLDRPVVYVECPEFWSTRDGYYSDYGSTSAEHIKNSPTANAGRHVGYVANTLNDLAVLVESVLANESNEKISARREYASQLRYNPGRASAIAANKVSELLKQAGLNENSD